MNTFGCSSGGSATAKRDRLEVTNVVSATITTSCGYVVPPGKVFRLDAVRPTTNGTLYFGTSCGSSDRGWMSVYQVYSGSNTGTTQPFHWPYPQYFPAGTYFYFSPSSGSGTAYISGVELEIEP